MCAFSHVIEPTDRVCKHSFACGLRRMYAFSHVIEPTERVCKHSFACGLCLMHANAADADDVGCQKLDPGA